MFPIIPYNYSNLIKNSLYFEPGVTQLSRVTANCDLPQNTTSLPVDPKELCIKNEKIDSQVEVQLNNEGKLVPMHKNSTSAWIQSIRLANDCHSYNARLCLDKSSKLIVEIIRPIKVGHELLVWFSEDILAILQMAFLTPTNIQGQKKYVCNICSTSFEYPNPLKIHMTLECGKYKLSILWERLAAFLLTDKLGQSKNNFSLNLPYNYALNLKENTKFSVLNLTVNDVTKTKEHQLSTSPILSRLSPMSTSSSPLPRPYSEPVHSSAFKPYSTKKSLNFSNNNTLSTSPSLNPFMNYPVNKSEPNLFTDNSYGKMLDLQHAAHMESIVSNLGKSKQGHLCIYCGKCYSRKYGLKIHIRTHTGYKPLKCKYCLRPFGDPSNLNKHVRLHAEGDTPYKCDLCGKVLVRRRDLERHLKSRHMEDIHLGPKLEVASSSSDLSD